MASPQILVLIFFPWTIEEAPQKKQSFTFILMFENLLVGQELQMM